MKRSVLTAISIQWGALAIGVLLGCWLLVAVLLPRLGLGEVDRIRQLGLHIDQRDTANDRLALTVLLGDSITREGVDTQIIADHWSEASRSHRFENWAVSGCTLVEQRIQLTRVLAAKPSRVVFAIGPTTLCHLQDMPLDKAYAYAFSGFDTQDWSESLPAGCGLETASLQALNAPTWKQHLHFRNAPKSWLNQRLRGAIKGSPTDRAANWTSPHYMTSSVGPEQLAWHLEQISDWWKVDRSHNVESGAAILASMIEETQRAGAEPVLALVPVHPLLHEVAQIGWRQTRPAVDDVAQRLHVAQIDATQQLTSAEFADALHPNRDGRDRYSRILASHLARPIMTARK